MKVSTIVAAAFLVSAGMTAPVYAQDKEKAKAPKKGGGEMTFFVTSVGKGNGADLGGLEGADAHCNALAKAAGSKLTNWKAYLSTTAPGGDAGVNARDRIGKGPWRNAKGVVVGKNVDDLHSARTTSTSRPRSPRRASRSRAAAIRRTSTTSSPDRTRPACTRPPAAIPPAATGPRAAKARRSSATTTCRG